MTDASALRLIVALAREVYLGGRCRTPEVGDLVIEVTGMGRPPDPDAIGWLAAHGRAPLHVDGSGEQREVWDVLALSGRRGAAGEALRWENAEFAALPPSVQAFASDARMLHTGEARVAVGLTLGELEELALATSNPDVRKRLILAVGLLDDTRAERTNKEAIW